MEIREVTKDERDLYESLRDAEFICASCGTNHTGRGGLLMRDGWGCEDPYCQY